MYSNLSIHCIAGFSNKREDIAAYVAKTLDDPRTVNKRLIVAPPKNRTTQLDLIRTWERVSGQSVKRTYMSAEEIETGIQGVIATPLLSLCE